MRSFGSPLALIPLRLRKRLGLLQRLFAGEDLHAVDPAGVYLGKFLANALFLLVTQVLVLPVFIIFFDTMVVADGCTLTVADDGRDSGMVKAA